MTSFGTGGADVICFMAVAAHVGILAFLWADAARAVVVGKTAISCLVRLLFKWLA